MPYCSRVGDIIRLARTCRHAYHAAIHEDSWSSFPIVHFSTTQPKMLQLLPSSAVFQHVHSSVRWVDDPEAQPVKAKDSGAAIKRRENVIHEERTNICSIRRLVELDVNRTGVTAAILGSMLHHPSIANNLRTLIMQNSTDDLIAQYVYLLRQLSTVRDSKLTRLECRSESGEGPSMTLRVRGGDWHLTLSWLDVHQIHEILAQVDVPVAFLALKQPRADRNRLLLVAEGGWASVRPRGCRHLIVKHSKHGEWLDSLRSEWSALRDPPTLVELKESEERPNWDNA